MASVITHPLVFSPLKTIKISASPTQRFHPKSLFSTLTFKNLRISSSLGPPNSESSVPNSSEKPLEPDPAEEKADTVKLAFAKAKAYKKAVISNPTPEIVQNPVQETAGTDKKSENLKLEVLNFEASKSEDKDSGKEEAPLSLKLAFEKAKEYKKNKGVVDENEVMKRNAHNSGIEVGKEGSPGNPLLRSNENKKEKLKISNMDFVGLEFSEKKKGKGLPAGLVPVIDPFPEGDLPEVEILVGDASNFGDGAASSKPLEDNGLNIYKPKVSTWGVFPRPNNISKTYGGGRNIRPGEVLETAADRAAKEARTRQLVAAYKSKIGLRIDPKLKFECEKALKDGDSLMNLGKLKEALPFYERIMDKLAFQTELYGLAALQWSICQDSINRPNEARVMYEKLQSHPNPQVSKKARQFNFSFQAMEMMKVTSTTRSHNNTGYQNYFDAFIRDKSNYSHEEDEVDEAVLSQALPYMILLLSPILIVILIAVQKAQN